MWVDCLKRMLADESHHRDVNHAMASMSAEQMFGEANPFIHEHKADYEAGVRRRTEAVLKKALGLGLRVLVVVNKIDKPDADPQKVRTALLQHEVFVETMGGDTLEVEVSAKTGKNLDKLLEAKSDIVRGAAVDAVSNVARGGHVGADELPLLRHGHHARRKRPQRPRTSQLPRLRTHAKQSSSPASGTATRSMRPAPPPALRPVSRTFRRRRRSSPRRRLTTRRCARLPTCFAMSPAR